MPRYITLLNFTDQGARNIRESSARADAATQLARKMGVEIEQIYWTMGGYDMVTISQAADGDTYTAFLVALRALGNVQGQSLRAFDKNEFASILKKSSMT